MPWVFKPNFMLLQNICEWYISDKLKYSFCYSICLLLHIYSLNKHILCELIIRIYRYVIKFNFYSIIIITCYIFQREIYFKIIVAVCYFSRWQWTYLMKIIIQLFLWTFSSLYLEMTSRFIYGIQVSETPRSKSSG